MSNQSPYHQNNPHWLDLPAWAGIGAIVGILALCFAIFIWFVPNPNPFFSQHNLTPTSQAVTPSPTICLQNANPALTNLVFDRHLGQLDSEYVVTVKNICNAPVSFTFQVTNAGWLTARLPSSTSFVSASSLGQQEVPANENTIFYFSVDQPSLPSSPGRYTGAVAILERGTQKDYQLKVTLVL